MNFQPTRLPEVILLTPRRFGDARGWFTETWNKRTLAQGGIEADFVQDNHSMSADVGTLRGLHYQAPPHAQDKLVRCTRGAIWDVAVDVRRGSPRYGQWVGVDLTAEGGEQLFVPKGFLHGFVTRTPDCEVQYKCTDYYAPESDGSVAWDSLGIDWGLNGAPVLSDKDRAAPAFGDWTSPFVMEGAA
ncbi:dTDP-4-dehydrorhamnose 3,5-epimerase [Sulfitobacter pseudonitzschiae]|uniref:dTDP-4-dehydrorhamnose 3,5-epimerase n=1 Tax=Pseudosulfitobacter pseudonitzschiae TaxID=1402135 RepID=A0A9Q2P5U6_9RHOB|nr:dTDP-4-dehydrorhamnose 3,5-epimerase [Pseudosulfitobacter pseudonitzschiae]MBM2294309.1 dTDP-4-dehydrorhamnose 3,5-epimerase [Pseudosulfitobacter pseudonitzschiae]MBM2299234.1 dTDP-4-dehydrorhamnose 3,5-epimerase [Pseudosulfitobacter pseudonitzschiae]MBM2304142.1 dTDP-4-dehydrorhamnose 3,5-epimerase [Pseudosulfitobacter pseudonitzschiae]MBM2313922.1 dTDP-4-dehydrorhamnose 3,5-epimerase [Pseudosulfitobacter pseudonitzschiae]MBM2318836.1 dTDP-4-dehydrorhamnose 3,5-epimerase [Pseudosulfitobact